MLEINKLYNEDCLVTLGRMNDEFIDLTVTSPPYDNLRSYKEYTFDFENTAKELFRVTKKGGVVVWVVGDATIDGSESGTSFRQVLYFKDIGFNLFSTKDKIDHPAIFPEALAKDHILSWSNEGDLVYDPFMGSGTTAKMAILLKRSWLGSEISAEYCEIAERRIYQYKVQSFLL